MKPPEFYGTSDRVRAAAQLEPLTFQAGGMSEKQARAAVLTALRQLLGEEPSRSVAHFGQVVGRAESHYGAGWNGTEGEGSNNWGAVQAGPPPCDPARSFETTDTHSNGEPYRRCFRKYPSPADGAYDMLRNVFTVPMAKKAHVLEAAETGDPYTFSAALYDRGYYEGRGATREARIAWHVKATADDRAAISKALDEPEGGGSPPGVGDVLTSGVKIGGVIVAGLVLTGLAIHLGKRR